MFSRRGLGASLNVLRCFESCVEGGKGSSGTEDSRAFFNFWDFCEAWDWEDLDRVFMTFRYSAERGEV